MIRWYAVAILVAVLALPDVASAARVSVVNGVLVFAEEVPEVNIVDVVPASTSYAAGFSVYDGRSELQVGNGCVRRTKGWAQCWAAVESIELSTGAKVDLITLRSISLPVRISSGDGSDLVETGSGLDIVDAGSGLDTVVGNGGDDVVDGGPGGDLLQGGDGGDTLAGKGGDDIVDGQAGSGDKLTGGAGQDLMTGGPGNDQLDGGAGADALVAGPGTDTLAGGPGADRIVTQGSTDTVTAPRSNDDVGPGVVEPSTRCDRIRVPTCWPAVSAAAMIADVPTRKPRVQAVARRQGQATYISVRVMDPIVYPVKIRLQLRNREGRLLRTIYPQVSTRNWVNVRSPRPSRATFTATGRCCY